jgi:hypothetical protein
VTTAAAQLLLYGFGPDAAFEGAIVGALQRMESGGTLRILGALFLHSDAETGELAAIDLRGRGAGSAVGPLLGFRLDEGERRRATKRALEAEAGGIPGETVRELGRALGPGAAVAALLVEHVWAAALEDAVSRSGGTPLVNELVDTDTLGAVAPGLLAAARRAGTIDSAAR